jgi:hypothetical protein
MPTNLCPENSNSDPKGPLLLVEMPGVEPGSEVESPKPTTRVFDLWGLALVVTDRQVHRGQYQCCLALRPVTRLHASLLKATPSQRATGSQLFDGMAS